MENFCEKRIINGKLSQPINTLSSFSFIIIAILILITKNTVILTPLFKKLFVITLSFMALSTILAHQNPSNKFLGHLDMYSMVVFVIFIILSNIAVIKKFSDKQLLNWFLFLTVLSTILFKYLNLSVFIILMFILVISFASIMFNNKFTKKNIYIYTSGIIFLFALIIWKYSKTGQRFCNPYSIIQGHAIWHILCAISIFFILKFYQSIHIV
jgi:hypothetical protein